MRIIHVDAKHKLDLKQESQIHSNVVNGYNASFLYSIEYLEMYTYLVET